MVNWRFVLLTRITTSIRLFGAHSLQVIRARIVGRIYSDSDNCLLPTLRDAEIHVEVEAIFRELWYRIARKDYYLEDRSIAAIQRGMRVSLFE